MRGARIGITAARRAPEQAALVRTLGGVPVVGAALRADPPTPDAELVPLLATALSHPVDLAVFLTGAGARLTLAAAQRHGMHDRLRAALAGAEVVARGPKPRAALREMGIDPRWVAEPPRTGVIAERLGARDLRGARVLVQGFGPEPEHLVARLRDAGARVVVVCPYGAGMPEDPGPARALAAAAARGDLAAVTFTSSRAVRQWCELAEAEGVDGEALRRSPTLFVSVGPVTREAMVEEGLRVDVEPETARMGAMYRALARRLASPDAGAPPAVGGPAG